MAPDRASEVWAGDPSRATPVELVPRVAEDPDAASAFERGGVVWGMCALVEGMPAAAREGAAGRIRDLAEAVLRLHPALDDAAGARRGEGAPEELAGGGTPRRGPPLAAGPS